jgi:hypothetical protein
MTAADPRDERPVAEAPEVRFERADVVAGVVVRWAIGLGLVSVVAGALSVWLLVFLRGREEAGDPQRPALYFSAEPRQPQGVRLQSKPFLDLQTLREQENEVLHKYGWVDQAAGVVHIPIDEAMKLYVARQAAAGPPSAAPAGIAETRVPTDSAPVPPPAAAPAPSPAASPAGDHR